MTDTCYKHSFEVATGVCRQCQNSYCTECLVYPRGERKPPYCVTCALSAAGVRRRGAEMNPRLRKKGIFGRRTVLEDEEPRRELGFYDVEIELPAEALDAPVMAHSSRRGVSPDLQSTVIAREEQFASVAAPEAASTSFDTSLDTSTTALDDWAASLGESVGTDEAPQVDPWPDSDEVAAWPDIDSSSGSPF